MVRMKRLLICGLSALLLWACRAQSPPPAQPSEPAVSATAGPPREYKLEGEIVSVDKEQKKATIKHGPIEGYMGAMTMAYPIPDAADLDKIKAGDHITATVYDSEAESKYWVGNIQVGEPPAQ